MYQAACVFQFHIVCKFVFNNTLSLSVPQLLKQRSAVLAMTMTLEEDMAMGIEKVEKEEDHAMAMKVVNASTIREILTYPLLTSPLKMALKLLEFVSMTYL